MNHGTLRHLWPKPRLATTTVASTTPRCFSNSAYRPKHFNHGQALAVVQKQHQRRQQQLPKQGGDDVQSLVSEYNIDQPYSGHLNLGLAEWARQNMIELRSHQVKPARSKEESKEMGVYVSYSRAHHPTEYHMKDLVLVSPLTVKYLADYERRSKNPLWIVLHASFNNRNVVRTTAMKKARRAFLAALKRNHYLPNGKAFSDDLVRGTELYGFIKILVSDPIKTVNTPMAKLATLFNSLLNRDIIPAIGRPVVKKSLKPAVSSF